MLAGMLVHNIATLMKSDRTLIRATSRFFITFFLLFLLFSSFYNFFIKKLFPCYENFLHPLPFLTRSITPTPYLLLTYETDCSHYAQRIQVLWRFLSNSSILMKIFLYFHLVSLYIFYIFTIFFVNFRNSCTKVPKY